MFLIVTNLIKMEGMGHLKKRVFKKNQKGMGGEKNLWKKNKWIAVLVLGGERWAKIFLKKKQPKFFFLEFFKPGTGGVLSF